MKLAVNEKWEINSTKLLMEPILQFRISVLMILVDTFWIINEMIKGRWLFLKVASLRWWFLEKTQVKHSYCDALFIFQSIKIELFLTSKRIYKNLPKQKYNTLPFILHIKIYKITYTWSKLEQRAKTSDLVLIQKKLPIWFINFSNPIRIGKSGQGVTQNPLSL